ncbi:MAG: hypothetical protein COS19_13995 [Flavobacteriaceae bacterium CG02_land_8_20_14_3_00_34_13]|nr:MAG: hypothetical protein COS19_13995 [Flavobacteriaceae bacterium CG02_land_8_20_14_3_00_34_13]PJC05977.1 MAG: hypothetical protein CO068_13570 [Flavobacteriaceae bacterium CG_4_9_14_0_8_um_filter_34_30]
MKKITIISALFLSTILYCQVPFPHIATNTSGAERVSSFGISNFALQRFEITNATVENDRFIPALWSHNGYDNRHVIQFHASTSNSFDNGSEPLIKFIASTVTNLNLQAPVGSQFPWGDGGTQNPLNNRPTFSWINGESTVMILSAQNNLGIGTITPTARLDINGSARFRNLLNSSTDNFVVTADANGNINRRLISEIGGGVSNNCGTLNFLTKTGSSGLNCSLIFDNGTNVGIGTTSPSEALHINGNIRGNQNSGALRIQTSTGYLDIGPKNTDNSSFDTDRDAFRFNRMIEVESGTFTSILAFDPSVVDLKFQTAGVTRIYANSTTGNVGIGTTSPAESLHINGNIRGNLASGALRVQTSSGFLDIGPKSSLTASFDTDRDAFRFNKQIQVNGGIITSANSFLPEDVDLKLQTNGSTRIFVNNSSGFVGVNTILPSANFHSKGSVRLEDLPIKSINFLLGIDNDGYVYKVRNTELELKESIENLINIVEYQQIQISELQNLVQIISSKSNLLSDVGVSKIINVSPNPSTGSVTVLLDIGDDVIDAKLSLNGINGSLLKNIIINERQSGLHKILSRDNLSSGTYLLSLHVDGKIIETKRIIFK